MDSKTVEEIIQDLSDLKNYWILEAETQKNDNYSVYRFCEDLDQLIKKYKEI